MLLFQQWYLSSSWIAPFVPEKSPYEEGSEQENNYYLGYCIPTVVFITKIGVNFTFQNAYQASFTENKIYPFTKRATAIGINNFVARGVTVLSSLAAELERPIPVSLLIGVTTISFINVLFLPTYSEEVAFDEMERKILDEGIDEKKED